eukprot:gene1447-15872_t
MEDEASVQENAIEMRSADEEEIIKINAIDEVLPYVGEFGKYQITLIFMLALMILTAGFPVLIMYFAGQNPPWQCVYNSTVCNLNGTFKSGDKNYNHRCSIPRAEWQFTKPKDYSIVTQFDIYCDTEHLIYLSTSLLFVGWGIGSFIFGWLADNYIPESMRWLRCQGRHAEVIEILKKAARVNGKTLPAKLELEAVPKADLAQKKLGILDLFRPLKMFQFSAVQGFAWFSSAAVYYGVSLGVSDLSGEMYRDFILAMLIEIPALVLSIFLMNRAGRKKSVIVTLALAGVFCCIVGGMLSTDNKQTKWKALTIIAGLSGKFCITCSFNSLYMWSLELYPTCIRGEGMGFLQITSRVGSALAPWIAKWLRVFHVTIPFSLMGALSLLSSVLLLILSETKGRETLETVNQLFKLDRKKNGDNLILENGTRSTSPDA